MKKLGFFILNLFFFSILSFSVITSQWIKEGKDELIKGKFNGVSLSEEGYIVLSVKEEKITTLSEDFFFSIALDSKENIYLGTGHGGKIYKIGRDGKSSLFFTASELDVFSLTVDKQDYVYAATSPNGKIYKLSPEGKAEVFFDPEEKYIWKLDFDSKGNLYAAVGERGGIYRIDKKGSGKLLFQPNEDHILSLIINERDEIFAGSGGKGVIYKIFPEGKTSVIYDTDFPEVKALVFDNRGNLWAGASGKEKKLEKISPELKKISETEIIPSFSIEVTTSASQEKLIPPVKIDKEQKSALYKIKPEGIVDEIWSSREEMIFSTCFDKKTNKILFGTGNKGRIYSVDKDGKVSLVLQKDSEQIFEIICPFSQSLFITDNPANVYKIDSAQRLEGEFLSEVLGSSIISSWGKIKWDGEFPAGTSVEIFSRTGNSEDPDNTWSDWSPPYKNSAGENILSPRNRYFQFKATIKSDSTNKTPVLRKVIIFYLQSNVSPLIKTITLFPPNEVYPKPLSFDEEIWGYEGEKVSLREKREGLIPTIVTKPYGKKLYKKGFQTVSWEATDSNGDELIYRILIKEEMDKEWRILKENLKDNTMAFDTLSFEEGNYQLKIVVSDLPSNPAGSEMKSEKVSAYFIIDNNPPSVENFLIKGQGGNKKEISFVGKDTFSAIKKVEYSLDFMNWNIIFPVDGINDSSIEEYRFTVVAPASNGFITVKVTDYLDNVGVIRKSL
ncbi:MAG: WD40 repeat domain-containing protein [Acidobacteriota bacterium]